MYALLSEGSTENSAGLHDMNWGAYWDTCLDRLGIRRMFHVAD